MYCVSNFNRTKENKVVKKLNAENLKSELWETHRLLIDLENELKELE